MKNPYRRLLLVPAAAALSIACPAQNNKMDNVWVDLGAKGGFGTTWLMNKNVFNDGYLEHNFSFGGGGGLKFGFNVNQVFEITVDGLMAFFNQSYAGSDTASNVAWTKKVNAGVIDMPVLLRFNLKGAYVEAGPQFSFVNKVQESHSGNFQGTERGDVTDKFAGSYMSGVIGFGRWVSTGVDNFNLAIGLRFMYGFGDILSDAGGKGQLSHYPDDDPVPVLYDSYAPTNPFSAQLFLEFNWDLAYIINRTVCHRTTGR